MYDWIKKNKSIFVFLPLILVICGTIVIIADNNIGPGDEERYLSFAENLKNGYYSPPTPNINLWNGPGYPLLIMPFLVIFNKPVYYIKVFNAILYIFSIIFIYKILKYYVSEKKAYFVLYLFALFFPYILTYVPTVLPEIYTIFLTTGFIYFYCTLYRNNKRKYSILAGIFLAILVLTKFIFAYVLLAIFLTSVLFAKSRNYKLNIMVLLVSIVLLIPYQVYTWSLTGKFFYWGNSGGLSLYWMSSPYKDELGDWYKSTLFNHEINFENNKNLHGYEDFMILVRDSLLKKNHSLTFKKMAHLNTVEKDNFLKQKALLNIKNHPQKFFKNWIANVGRFFFHYPFSYRDQTINTYIVLIPNMILLFLFICSFLLSLYLKIFIPFELKFLVFIGIVYFAGSSLLSAYSRFFFPIIPILILFTSFVLNRVDIIKKVEY